MTYGRGVGKKFSLEGFGIECGSSFFSTSSSGGDAETLADMLNCY
jgi:hypothetical protein